MTLEQIKVDKDNIIQKTKAFSEQIKNLETQKAQLMQANQGYQKQFTQLKETFEVHK